ncbi:uncharacterized protein LOC114415087 isoform X4 [Glycine soja]|uniref:uncharacterized protein LOC114415087 isoform X4 n=1 Tax=Glycine soja TaxID=3848 RepID=UPI00103F673F|nr:uncharacterized protein LOC114415087 isoform X4 [Glycine soja]
MATMSLTFAVAAPSLNYLPSTTQTVIMCEPCNGTGWLVCDFCNGQKTNVKAQNNKPWICLVFKLQSLQMILGLALQLVISMILQKAHGS